MREAWLRGKLLSPPLSKSILVWVQVTMVDRGRLRDVMMHDGFSFHLLIG